jgi:hypothetical protein
MAETLGSLCDKLTIVKLKQWHSPDPQAQENLSRQERQLQAEIGEFVEAALAGAIPLERLTVASNKVYKKEGHEIGEITGAIGEVISRLADANCRLWHCQEQVYDFERVPVPEKDGVVKQLAVLNLERVKCVDQIDILFAKHLTAAREKSR